jgi:hypothetical protein
MRYISRSSHECFSACRRKGYYRYLLHGTGYSEVQTPVNFAIGLLLHKGMEVLFLSGGDIEEAHQALLEEALLYPHLTLEDRSIARALLLGWFRTKWELFNEEFQVLMIEKEIEALLSPSVTLQARADLVVRSLENGRNFVFNWKTTSSKSNWNKKWRHDVQAWTEALAIEDALGERVEGCIFEGFYKGTKYAGMSTSPLIYGFQKEENGRKLFKAERTTGYVKFPTFVNEWYPSLEEWILFLPPEVVEEQFIRSEPIMKNDDVVRKWISQVVREEEDIQHVLDSEISDEEREIFFIQRFGEQCEWCPFKDLCGLRSDVGSLVDGGFLKERVDHHAVKG